MEVEASTTSKSVAVNGSEAMETDTEGSVIKIGQENKEGSKPMASSSASVAVPTIAVSLHPLVIMNVSEHWTRLRAQQDPSSTENIIIIGAFIGKQKGRNIEIMNSFELKFDLVETKVVLDTDYYRTKELQFKQVFPDLDFLGWYTNGDEPTDSDMSVHYQISNEIHESPLFLKLNPLGRQTSLPIKLYESAIEVINCIPTMYFVNIPYSLATEEAERIGLDHMARMTSTANNSENGNSAATDHLRVQYNAVKMLRNRVRLILDYIKDTKSGKIPVNHEVLREIFNLCHRMPIISSDGFNEEFFVQSNDVALLTYLGALTKCSNTINQFVNKFSTLMERQSLGRRVRLY